MRQGILIYDESGNRADVNESGRLLVDAAGVSVSASGIALSVSGNAVYLVSGQNIVNASGATVIALISGQTVVGSFVANVSGQVVHLVSGVNPVQMSGQVVNISGAFISTQVWDSAFLNSAEVSQPDDDTHANTTFGLETISYLYAADNSTNYRRVRVTASGQGMSGIPHRLAVITSGDTVFEYGSNLITNPMTQVTSDSGGIPLSSGSVFSVTINNESGNAPIWVGGAGTQAPFSGKGLHVYGGASLSLRIDSVDDIRVFGETSGQFVSWLGVQK